MGPVVWTYALPDALGSVRQETDATGTVTAAREWSPYGVEVGTAQAGGLQTGLGYTGEWFDTSVGMAYLRARWYDGDTGRFTSPDPVVPDFYTPQGTHRYVYVENNAINLIDPTGLSSVAKEWCREHGWSEPALSAFCKPAVSGNLRARWNLYRSLALGGDLWMNWDVGAMLLNHHIGAGDGGQSLGQPVFLLEHRDWLLNGPEDNDAYQGLLYRFVSLLSGPFKDTCSPPIPVRTVLRSGVITPVVSTDIGVALGKHYLNVQFDAMVWPASRMVEYNAFFFVHDIHDFDPLKKLDLKGSGGIGEIPHEWIISLENNGWAAIFDIYLAWDEKGTIAW
jgi:RHS repeat-associated protein